MTPQQIIEYARHEELITVALVARAAGMSSRTIVRDWKRRRYPVTKIGRTVLLPSALVLSTYFPHRISGHS